MWAYCFSNVLMLSSLNSVNKAPNRLLSDLIVESDWFIWPFSGGFKSLKRVFNGCWRFVPIKYSDYLTCWKPKKKTPWSSSRKNGNSKQTRQCRIPAARWLSKQGDLQSLTGFKQDCGPQMTLLSMMMADRGGRIFGQMFCLWLGGGRGRNSRTHPHRTLQDCENVHTVYDEMDKMAQHFCTAWNYPVEEVFGFFRSPYPLCSREKLDIVLKNHRINRLISSCLDLDSRF